MHEARESSGFRGKAAAGAALLLLTLAAAPAIAQEKPKEARPLTFKSRVIQAPNAAGSVQGAVAEVLRQAYEKSKGAPLSAGERADMMVRLEKAFRLNRSSDGLKELASRNGTVSIDLQGRYQYVYLARTNPDGTVSIGCVTDWDSARAFLSGARTGVPTKELE